MTAMASSTVVYCTDADLSGITSLMDLLSGYDKWCINLYYPGNFFSTKPMGEITRLGKGGSLNGPNTLPAAISARIFSLTMAGLCETEQRVWTLVLFGTGPMKPVLKPFVNPSTKHLRISGSVHLSASSRCSTLIGVTWTHPVALVTREVFEPCWCELSGLGAKRLWSETLVAKVLPSMGILSTKRLIDRMSA